MQAPTPKGRIGIMGTPTTSGNRGVLALGSSLVELCLTHGRHADVFLLLGNKQAAPVNFRVNRRWREVDVVNYRLSPKSRPTQHLAWIVLMAVLYRLIPIPAARRCIGRITPWIREIEQAVFVGDIRGGDSFSDIYGYQRFFLGFLAAWSVILVKGSLVQFPQTYGPYKHRLGRWMATYLLNRSSPIVARDKESQRVAQALVGRSKQVLLSPDVAFSLSVNRPEVIALSPPLDGDMPREIIGINVNGLMFNGGYTRKNMFDLKMDYSKFVTDLLLSLLNETSSEIWLIPHTYAGATSVESDNEANRRARESLPAALKGRVRIVTGEYDQHELKGIIGLCGFFIGSRMHACIAALSQGIPCVGVAYSMKFRGVFETVGMEDWVIEGRAMAEGPAIERILTLYRDRESIRGSLRMKADKARETLNGVFAALFTR